MLQKTHRFIAKNVADSAIIDIGKYKKFLILGSEYEYYSFRILGWHHFYNPKNKEGYSKKVESAKEKGLMLFNRAVLLYKKGRYNTAYYTLGRSFHYLADVASPAHTKLIYHLGEDNFEIYMDNFLRRFKLEIKLKIVPPMKPEYCFEKLSQKSYNLRYKKTTPMIYFFKYLLISPKVKKSKQMELDSQKILESSLIYTMALFRYFDLKVAGSKIKNLFKPKKT